MDAIRNLPTTRTRLHDQLRTRTTRDRQLLQLLADHQVLTTAQIAQAWGAPLRRTQHRLTRLYQYRVLDRFRPYTAYGAGSAPYHWTLGPIGALEAAAARDATPAQLGWKPYRTTELAVSTQLGHRIGANGLFTALIAHTHRDLDSRLEIWQSPAAFTAGQAVTIRPDGYGVFSGQYDGQHRRLRFVVEHDTGTEPLPQLAGKLARYARLPDPPVVLFRFLTDTRDHAARRYLADHPALRAGSLTAATTVLPHPPDRDPAGPIWTPLPAQPGLPGPVPLLELARLDHPS
jgi:hypothetical protein